MSWLKKLLKPGNQAPTPEDATARLGELRDMLEKKTAFLEKKIDEQTDIAKSNAKSNKRVAMLAMKRRQRYQKELSQTDNSLSTIELQRDALDNAHTQREIFTVMEAARSALARQHGNMSIDDVERLRDDIEDQLDLSEELTRVMSTPLASLEEGDMEEELLQLIAESEEEEEQQRLDRELMAIPSGEDHSLHMPAVPSGEDHSLPEPAVASSYRPISKLGPSTGTGLPRLPNVPQHTPLAASEDENEMAELKHWAAA